MHLIIPFASSLSEGCLAAQPTLQLPNLQKLLGRLTPLPPDQGDDFSRSTPAERALAQALQLPTTDGQIPWAALHAHHTCCAAGSGQPARAPAAADSAVAIANTRPAGANQAWAFVTLCHWQVNTHHVAMSQLPLPELSAAESDALLAAMQPYFEEDGIALYADQLGRWLAQAALFEHLVSASTDRVVGRNLAAWMPEAKAAAPLRRLQNEMQMLLYTHPVNDAREARGLPPVNSFWLDGSGALPAGYQFPALDSRPVLADSLRQPALTENWPAWVLAWQALEESHLAPLLQALDQGQPVQLTLCGERHSQSWTVQRTGLWRKISSLFASQPIAGLLALL